MAIPRIYRTLPEQNLASYDFYDLSTGTGYKNFYGGDLTIAGGTNFKFLGTQVCRSVLGYTLIYQTTTDIDFDVTFEVPITIKGKAIINIPYGSASNVSGNLTMSLYHVNLSNVETLIGSAITMGYGANNSFNMANGLYVIPLVRFKAGEKLRLNITADNPGSTKYLTWYHDPQDRQISAPSSIAGTAVQTSRLLINLPIKL